MLLLLFYLKSWEKNSSEGIGKILDTAKTKFGSREDNFYMDDIGAYEWPFKSRDIKQQEWHYDPENIKEKFKLFGIEFGRWMNQADRQYFLSGIAISLLDLSKLLKVPQYKIGLNGTLSIGLGSWGRGGKAAASYYPYPHALINLTKTHGPGSFAHEYAHSIDFFIQYYFNEKRPPTWGDSVRKGYIDKTFKNLEYKNFVTLFSDVLVTLIGTGSNLTEFGKRLDGQGIYWKRREEIWARTFERYILVKLKRAGIKNTFLQESNLSPLYYPTASELKKVEGSIDKIIRQTFKLY